MPILHHLRSNFLIDTVLGSRFNVTLDVLASTVVLCACCSPLSDDTFNVHSDFFQHPNPLHNKLLRLTARSHLYHLMHTVR